MLSKIIKAITKGMYVMSIAFLLAPGPLSLQVRSNATKQRKQTSRSTQYESYG